MISFGGATVQWRWYRFHEEMVNETRNLGLHLSQTYLEGAGELQPSIEQVTACRDSRKSSRLSLLATEGRFILAAALLVLMHAGFMLYHFGQVPIAPFVGDEIIIHDPAISL